MNELAVIAALAALVLLGVGIELFERRADRRRRDQHHRDDHRRLLAELARHKPERDQ